MWYLYNCYVILYNWCLCICINDNDLFLSQNNFGLLAVYNYVNLIIKNILVKHFFVAYNCTKDDYKLWSPTSSKDHLKISCVLGQTQVFQRRAPKANCYNGMNYDRPVQTMTCDCDTEDYTW